MRITSSARQMFERVDCDPDAAEYSLAVSDAPLTRLTVSFDYPTEKAERAALRVLDRRSTREYHSDFEDAVRFESGEYCYVADTDPIGYECVSGGKSGFIVLPEATIFKIPKSL